LTEYFSFSYTAQQTSIHRKHLIKFEDTSITATIFFRMVYTPFPFVHHMGTTPTASHQILIGMIAQLLKAFHRYCKVKGSNPIEA